MKMLAITVLAAFSLAAQTLALADDSGHRSPPNMTSYAPHGKSSRHSFGAPIQPPIVGHAKSSHHKLVHHKTAARSAR
jgi:hypothetical protein